MKPEPIVVQRGTWLYDGAVRCPVHIEERSIAAGSGDYEDLPEIREDREGRFYYICYGSPLESNRVLSEVGPFSTAAEAAAHVGESTHGTILWAS